MKNILVFDKYPLLPLAIFLIIGIIAGSKMCELLDSFHWLYLFLINILLCFFLDKYRVIQTIMILLSMFFLGGTLSSRLELIKKIYIPTHFDEYKGVIASEPIERGKTIRFDVQIAEGNLSGKMIKVSVLKDSIYPKHTLFNVNDGLIFRTKLSPHKNFYDSNFDYAKYLYNHGFIAQTLLYPGNWSFSKVSLIKLSIIDRARLKALRIRHGLLNELKLKGLQGQVYAIVAAMVMGDKSALSNETREIYSKIGVSHVLALSGMHLGIIYAIMSLVCFRRRYKTFGSIILVCSIWTYVFLVGMMPSVVRSALMLSIMTLVGLSGRNPMSLNVLSFAAIVMLINNPMILYDIGFQLSFLAVGFIVTFYKSFNTIVPILYQENHIIIRWFWQLSLVSILAQLGTMPLVVYYFSNIPLLSLLGNWVVVPCATVIIYLSFFTIVLSFIPCIGYYFGLLLTMVVSFMNVFFQYFSSLPFSSIENIYINWKQTIIAYLIILCGLFVIKLYIQYKPEQK